MRIDTGYKDAKLTCLFACMGTKIILNNLK